MKYNYNIIIDCLKSFEDFKKITHTSGELAKIKFIKYNRISHLLIDYRNEKDKHIRNQNYEYASLYRDKEKHYLNMIVKLLNIEEN